MSKRKAESAVPGAKRRKVVVRKKKPGYNSGRAFKKSPKSELKAFDVSNTTTLLSTTATFQALNLPLLGTDYFHRVGRKIYMKSLKLSGYIYQNVAEESVSYARIMVVYDSQPNGALPAIADLLQDANPGSATSPFSQINLNNRERFTILRDHKILMAVGINNADYIDQSLRIDDFIKVNMESTYNSTDGGTILDLNSGSLLLVTYCISNADEPNFQWSSRLRFYD